MQVGTRGPVGDVRRRRNPLSPREAPQGFHLLVEGIDHRSTVTREAPDGADFHVGKYPTGHKTQILQFHQRDSTDLESLLGGNRWIHYRPFTTQLGRHRSIPTETLQKHSDQTLQERRPLRCSRRERGQQLHLRFGRGDPPALRATPTSFAPLAAK